MEIITLDEILNSKYVGNGHYVIVLFSEHLLNILKNHGYRWIGEKHLCYNKKLLLELKKSCVLFIFKDKSVLYDQLCYIDSEKDKVYKFLNRCNGCNEKLKPIKAIEQIIYYCPKCKK